MVRGLRSGEVKFFWAMVTNPFQDFANANEWIRAAREKDNFIVVSDCYPTVSAKVADLVLPVAMIYEKWGAYGNAERRTQHWRQQVKAPGEAKGDLWQILEFSKRFKLKEVWKEQPLPGLGRGLRGGKLPDVLAEAKKMGYRPGADALRGALRHAGDKKYAWPDPIADGHPNDIAEDFGLLRPQGAVAGVPPVRSRQRPRSGGLRHLPPRARPALAGGQRARDPVALPRGLRPLREARQGLRLLRQGAEEDPVRRSPRARRSIWPARRRSSSGPTPSPPRAPTRSTTCGSAPAGCSSTGTRAR